ncbi:hypothetical protein BD626DRAFT_204483 [Schizophyllum amplum]|uniref:Fungal-type protein kinase domain-containing protein n=1 Tax=Schizophyllum amplum TaxID=97359 RepID=A0A550BZA3_9AGAR|nr:hypothetical protein BD626DRAFT_204483 [Auriculariopsis ampla]
MQAILCAVLNDWDLADTDAYPDTPSPPSSAFTPTISPPHSPLVTRPLHTIPFASIDLLDAVDRGRGGKVRHLYRYDLEALVWVLTWTVCCYENGMRRQPLPPYMRKWVSVRRPDRIRRLNETWVDADPHSCSLAKDDFIRTFPEQVPHETWTPGHKLAILLLDNMSWLQYQRQTDRRLGRIDADFRQLMAQKKFHELYLRIISREEPEEPDEPLACWRALWVSVRDVIEEYTKDIVTGDTDMEFVLGQISGMEDALE